MATNVEREPRCPRCLHWSCPAADLQTADPASDDALFAVMQSGPITLEQARKALAELRCTGTRAT